MDTIEISDMKEINLAAQFLQVTEKEFVKPTFLKISVDKCSSENILHLKASEK